MTFKRNKISRWPLIKKNSYYQEKLQNNEVTWSMLNKLLNAGETFFVDEDGWTIQPFGRDVIPDNTIKMFCGFEIERKDGKRQHFYAWRQRKSNGKMGGTQFGTRLLFGDVSLGKQND